jgi:UTP--glucose-1-phosphate uridylyltransferase
MTDLALTHAQDKMVEAGVAPGAVRVFSHYFQLLQSGYLGMISEVDIEPFLNPVLANTLDFTADVKRDAMRKTALIRLNGGLGTSMGLERAKTLIPVRDGKNFLEIIVCQTRHARRRYSATLPLIFMNSYRTNTDTLECLSQFKDLPVEGLPLSFLQSKEPRLDAESLEPIAVPKSPEYEWCPPGHGDLYVSLESSGILDLLIDHGFEFAQVSNGDNLGATADGSIAAWFASSAATFAMEVCTRTSNDRKGGHLARRRGDGALILRESAQTADGDRAAFEDIDLHPYFNTNTLWLNLPRLRDALTSRDSILGLPLIRNIKNVDQGEDETLTVVQLETAMGSAIEVFEDAQAILVPRSRFLPVKTTNELLLLRSNLYEMGDDCGLELTTETTPRVDLEATYYAHLDQYESRIPKSPSMRRATSLRVEGDWYFVPGSTVEGDVLLGKEGGIYQ